VGEQHRQPNAKLRAARLRRGWTHQQLAERVASSVYRTTGRERPIDADHVSKLERGLITWPSEDYRTAFRAVLGAQYDEDLGFYSRRSRECRVDGTVRREGVGARDASAGNRPPPSAAPFSASLGVLLRAFEDFVDRRGFLSLLGVAGLTAVLPVEGVGCAGGIGGNAVRVDVKLLDDLEVITDQLTEMNWSMSPDVVLDPLRAHLVSLLRLYGASPSDRLGAITGKTAALTGWVLHEAGRDKEARHCFLLHADIARENDDRAGLAYALTATAVTFACDAYGAVSRRMRRDLTEEAEALGRRGLTPAHGSWVAVCRAIVLAEDGRESPAWRAMECGQAGLAQMEPEERTGFFRHWDQGRVLGWRANAHLSLGQPQRAAQLYRQTLSDMSPALVKHRPSVLTDLAGAYVQMREPEEGSRTLREALRLARMYGIGEGGIHDVRRALAPWNALSAVRTLDAELLAG
jgi:transcriptional regulator with XRE-family HTH domain